MKLIKYLFYVYILGYIVESNFGVNNRVIVGRKIYFTNIEKHSGSWYSVKIVGRSVMKVGGSIVIKPINKKFTFLNNY